ncbi:unnamed protein product [Rhizoctonia solani]|uniref:Large ribosomal subunit protein mL54 n=1 Tax=Rhizoctonia solani TaxID=456999 RepID=A0A8H3D2R3_9AGAM|nr:unnamed protein product [Rhizoctonia solani]CAE6507839.1 unnamed protein product [Rhizoctonia solani]
MMSARIVSRTSFHAYKRNCQTFSIRFSSSSTEKVTSTPTSTSPKAPISSCPANTNLTGLTWLKSQPPVLALEDSEYPAWLWTLLDEKKPGDGTSKPERRKQNRDKIKLQNFMKSQ